MALQLSYENGEKKLQLAPLKGQINPEKCGYTVGKVKVEIRLAKVVAGRWGSIVGDSPDRASRTSSSCPLPLTGICSSGRRTGHLHPKRNRTRSRAPPGAQELGLDHGYDPLHRQSPVVERGPEFGRRRGRERVLPEALCGRGRRHAPGDAQELPGERRDDPQHELGRGR